MKNLVTSNICQNDLQNGEKPLISVVIPAYNSEVYIAEAITSVILQDYTPLEIIVIDDGSIDKTVEIVSSFAEQVRLFTQENKGSAAARNLGIKEAKGQYIAFLDADDVWWAGKLRYQVDAMLLSGYEMSYGRFIRWYQSEDGQFSRYELEFNDQNNPNTSTAKLASGWLYAELLLDCIVWTSTVVVKKSVLEKAGLFDESLRKGQDYDLWLRLARQIKMLGLEKPIALYRIHSSNITSSVKEVNYEYLILSRSVALMGDNAQDDCVLPIGLVTERLARSSFAHGYAHLKCGDPRIAINSFRTSMTHSGFRIKTFILILIAKIKSFVAKRVI